MTRRQQPGFAEGVDEIGLREQQGREREGRGGVGQHAGWPHHQHGIAESLHLALARDQPVARREGQLHAVREADHHDEGRHHVEEHVEPEVHPAEGTERQQDGDQRRTGRHDHERHAAEEQDRDQAPCPEADRIVEEPVTLDRVMDFELHHGHARQLALEARSIEIVVHGLADFGDRLRRVGACRDVGIERQDHQGEVAIVRQELAPDDVVAADPVDQLIVGRPFRQRLGEQGRRDGMAGLGRLAGREERYDALGAVDELQVGDEAAQMLERIAFKQRLARDHDQNVEFVRREAPRHILELMVFGRVGPEQLAQRIIDLEPRYAEGRADRECQEDEGRHERRPDGDEADALQAERNVDLASGRRPRGGWSPRRSSIARKVGQTRTPARVSGLGRT